MKLKQLFSILGYCCLLSLSACASSPSKQPVSTQHESFLNGEILLECKLSCSMTFGTAAPDLYQLYKAELWNELANKVIEIGYNMDIAYFYLGRAAEGLDSPKAARRYYLLSKTAWSWCMYPTCQGLSFPEATNERLNLLKQQDSVIATSESSTSVSAETVSSLNINHTKGINKQCKINSDCKLNEICQVQSEFESKCIPKEAIPPIDQEIQQAEIISKSLNEIKLVSVGGVYEVPVSLNNVLKINVILDSGASEVSIAPDVALTLIRTGTIEKSDWLEGKIYRFADGSTAKSKRFKLKSVTIGNKTLRNVTCSIANSIDAPMLMGQNVLRQLGKYTIDYNKGIMQFE